MEKGSPLEFHSVNQVHDWFEKNHSTAEELHIKFFNVKSGKAGLRYGEALDEALCFGWIDGVRRNLDEESYVIRFTPRKKTSIWSNVNTQRMSELIKAGRVQESGLRAFNQRSEKRSGVYSFEQGKQELAPAYEKQFKSDKNAWKFFSSQAPWYQRTSIHWVMSAKQESTRLKRLAMLISDSAKGERIALLSRKPKG